MLCINCRPAAQEVSENGGEVAGSTVKARAIIAEADAEL